jgi:hypothetical protein
MEIIKLVLKCIIDLMYCDNCTLDSLGLTDKELRG